MFDWFHNRVPYTDFQQKNLDWLTETVREGEAAVEAKIEEADTAIENAEAATEAANTAKTGADDAATTANNAATAANNAKDAANTAAANAQAAADKWATPYASTTVAGMTDHAKIYVYTGTEVGYTAGNWYYWNGTTWTSGGVYVGDISDAVLFSTSQSKTDVEKAQARANCGAASEAVANGFIEKHNLFPLADGYYTGKYFDGNPVVNVDYNYYSNIPINKGDSYIFDAVVRFVVIMVNNVKVKQYENIDKFTSDYDGYAFVTVEANRPANIMAYNNVWLFVKSAETKTFDGYVCDYDGHTNVQLDIPFEASAGDIIYFKLSNYTGSHFSYAFLYNFIDNTPERIQASVLYDENGEALFVADTAITKLRIYSQVSQAESETIIASITNLSKENLINIIRSQSIKARLWSSIAGKTIAFLGDSFTYGSYTYVSKMKNRYLCNPINYGVASSRIVLDTGSGDDTVLSFLNRYSDMDDDADIVCVFGGINDAYDLGAGLLSIGNINSTMDTTTFYGGMKLLVTDLMKKYPDKQIIGIIPPDCQYGAYYIANLPSVQQAERDVYEMYGVPYIDIKKECFKMSTLSEMVAIYRGSSTDIHPSDAGQEALCDAISSGIRRIIPN